MSKVTKTEVDYFDWAQRNNNNVEFDIMKGFHHNEIGAWFDVYIKGDCKDLHEEYALHLTSCYLDMNSRFSRQSCKKLCLMIQYNIYHN